MPKFEYRTESKLVSYVHIRVMKRNQNFLSCFTGQTGSGKTYGALCFAEVVSEMNGIGFSIENVVFDAKKLMALINSGKLKKGSVIVFDEAGVGYNNREWQSIGNKMLNYLMQTFRHRNYVLIFTMPDFSFVDVAARKLFHCRFETVLIDYATNQLYCKPFMLTVNQMFGKQYNKYFRIPEKGSLFALKVERVAFKLPSPELIETYEAKKKVYTDQLNKEIEAALQEGGRKETMTPVQANWIFARTRMGMSISEASKALGITYHNGYTMDSNLKIKGLLEESLLSQSNVIIRGKNGQTVQK